jgi:hypothetical protein
MAAIIVLLSQRHPLLIRQQDFLRWNAGHTLLTKSEQYGICQHLPYIGFRYAIAAPARRTLMEGRSTLTRLNAKQSLM